MTTIKERVIARNDLLKAYQFRDLNALTEGLNALPEYVRKDRYVTARTLLAECAEGAAILTALDAAVAGSVAVKFAVRFLGQDSGLNIGDAVTQIVLDSLVPSVLTQAQADAIKALAMQPFYVTREEVEKALYNLDGTEK